MDFNYGFYSCLINTPEVDDDPQIENCLFDNSKSDVCREKNFVDYFNEETLLSSFSLVEKSQAIGNGDVSVSRNSYPYDRLGVPRLSDGMSDIGCYEFVPSESNE